MQLRYSVLLTSALLMAGAPVHAAPQAPTGSWYADFGAAQCTATRNYGTAANPLYLILKLPPLGNVLQIGVAAKGAPRNPTQFDGEIMFDDAPPIAVNLLEYGVRTLDQRMLVGNLPLAQLNAMSSAASIRIRTRQPSAGLNHPGAQRTISRLTPVFTASDYHLKLSSVGQLLKTLRGCADGLRKTWNIEEAALTPTLVKEWPKGTLAGVFRDTDYPASAISKEQSGSVRLAVLVDERGKVADCTVIQTSGAAVLDAQSCAIVLQRARLTPAVGHDGKPAKGAFIQPITWRIQG